MVRINDEAKRLHEWHCVGCPEYGNHGGGKVSTSAEAARGEQEDPGSIPGRSTTHVHTVDCADC